MKKTTLIISISVLIILAISFFVWNSNKKVPEQIQTPENTTTTPITQEPTIKEPTSSEPIVGEPEPETPFIKPEGDRFEIKTPNGPVSISNVYKKSIGDGGFNGVIFKNNTQYYIAYYPSPEGFIITIHNKDMEKARIAAETDFIKTLNISKEDACKLNVNLMVPLDINENIAGQNFGLSFCPDGKVFPK